MLRKYWVAWVVVLLVSCSGDDDSSPPTILAITPSDGAAEVWLHDPITVTFSEAIDPATVTATTVVVTADDGSVLPSTAVLDDAGSALTVRIADEVALRGSVRLSLASAITDRSANALVETSFGWTLPAWSQRAASGLTPSVAVDGGNRVVIAASVGGAVGARRIVVSEVGETGLVALGGELGEGDAALPSITFDAQDRPLVVWSEFGATATVRAARWDGGAWLPLDGPGEGSYAVAARAPGADPVIAYVTPSTDANLARLRLQQLAGDAWQPFAGDVAVNGAVIGLPQLALGAPDRPVVAFAETGGVGSGGNTPAVRVARWTGAWRETSIPIGAPANQAELNRVAVAAQGDSVVVAYDTYSGFSFGVHVVHVHDQGFTPIGGELDVDSPGNAQAPAIAFDADGTPVVAWRELVEGNWRGFLARWDGSAWRAVGGGAWNPDPGDAIVRPMLALAGGRAPVLAWAGTSLHVARWNGPSVPQLGIAGRASISGCAFDQSVTTLGATGCFTIANGRATPHPGLIPFDIVTELWSDGARKRRWIALPDGQGMNVSQAGAWTAPAGTMMIKEFAIETTPGDPRTRRVMETRFLINGGNAGLATWEGFSFRWRPDGSDADLLPDTASTVDWPLDDGNVHTHSYPSRAQCARCHHASNGPLLGVRPGQFARRFDYDGVIADQLETLSHIGAIAPMSDVRAFASPHDVTLPLETRMRGYLAANCSHCHNPGGERPTRDFRWETPLALTNLCGADSEVVAGHPEQSTIFVRISTRVNGMPPLATLKTDPLAIDVIGRWIAGETNCL